MECAWECIASHAFPPRTGHSCCDYKGKLYVFGGTSDISRLNDLIEFDPISSCIKLLQPGGEIVPSRTSAAMTCVADKLYLWGGNDDDIYSNDLYAFDGNNWELVPAVGLIPHGRSNHTMITVSSSTFLVFGGGSSDLLFSDFWEFNFFTSRWTPIQPSYELAPRLAHSMTPFKSNDNSICACIFGGWDGSRPLSDLYIYNRGVVMSMEPTGLAPCPRYRHNAIFIPSKKGILISGGTGPKRKQLSDIWLLVGLGSMEMAWIEVLITTPLNFSVRSYSKMASFIKFDEIEDEQSFQEVVSNKIFLFGGFHEGTRFGDVQRLTIKNIKNPHNIEPNLGRNQSATDGSPNDSSQQVFLLEPSSTDQTRIDIEQQPATNVSLTPSLYDFNTAVLQSLSITNNSTLNNLQNMDLNNSCTSGFPSLPAADGNLTRLSKKSLWESTFTEGSDIPQPEELYKWSFICGENDEPLSERERDNKSADYPNRLSVGTFSARTGHITFPYLDRVFIFGGTDDQARRSDIHSLKIAPFGDAKPFYYLPEELSQFSSNDSFLQQSMRMPVNEWIQETTSGQGPRPRSGSRCCVIGDACYIFGGYTKKLGDHFNDLFKLCLKTMKWTELPRVVDNIVILDAINKSLSKSKELEPDCGTTTVSGNNNTDQSDSTSINNSAGQQNAEQNQHQMSDEAMEELLAQNIPVERTDHAVCELMGRGWVCGGFSGKNRLGDLFSFNTNGEWRGHTGRNNRNSAVRSNYNDGNTIPPRFGHSMVSFESSLFVFGGWDGRSTLSETWEFSVLPGRWVNMTTSGEIPSSRYRHSAARHGCNMFIFGGVDSTQTRFNDIYMLDLHMHTWVMIQTMGLPPSPRTFHHAVMIGHNMVIVGGFDGKRRNDSHQILVKRGESDKDRLKRLLKDRKHLLYNSSTSISNQIKDNRHDLIEMVSTIESKNDTLAKNPEASSTAYEKMNFSSLPATMTCNLNWISDSYSGSLPLVELISTFGLESTLVALAKEVEIRMRISSELEEKTCCKICLSRPATMVFEPCLHKFACEDCASCLDVCAICRRDVKRRINCIEC